MTPEESITLGMSIVGLAGAALTGFIGWRVGTAQDAVRIKYQADAIDTLTAHVERLRSDLAMETRQLSASTAAIGSALESTARLLDRMEQRVCKLEDRSHGPRQGG